jgi:predicted nucleic acid-binding protein
MIVVDTNVICYLFVESAHSRDAERALIEDPGWVAPLLWRSEFRNVVAQYIRKQWLSLAEGRIIMNEALHLMDDQEYEVDSQQVLSLVAGSNCSAYDCEFVALAQQLRVVLVTVDKEILGNFPDVTVSLSTFVAAPRPKH